MGFFLKFISWSRRIVLERFQNDPDSLKCGKSNEKNVDRLNLRTFCYLGGVWHPEVRAPNMQKIGYIFFREKFSTRKNYFFSKTFFCVKFHRSAFQCATLYCQRITQTKTAPHQSHQPPPRPESRITLLIYLRMLQYFSIQMLLV